MEYYSVLTGIQSCENIILKLCFWNFYIFVMILKFHIQHYLNNSKKWHKQHSLAANFTYGTLKSGLDLQCIDIADMLQTISRDQTFPRRQVIRKITAVCLSQVTPSIIIERHIVDDTCKMLFSKAEVLFCPQIVGEIQCHFDLNDSSENEGHQWQ